MIKRIITVLIAILIIAIGVVAYSFLRTPEQASGPIEAIPITNEAQEATVAEASSATAEGTSTSVEEAEPQADTAVETDTAAESETQAEASTASEAEATIVTETGEQASGEDDETTTSPVTFEIVPAESEARFIIDEVLRGSPKTVVGITDQLAGQLALNPDDLPAAQVGTIQVNARTLATDNDFRNRAVKNQILRTNDHEFVTFAPTEIIGLPETGAVGETYTFQIVGDLTVTDVTRPATFDVVATATSETRIEGTATTAFPYTDFELFIPDSPSVDTIDDVVRLELEFVAEAVS
jgi:polyisoprenoid-binding protein YceI